MKASFFSIGTYRDEKASVAPALVGGWPAPPALWDPEAGRAAMDRTLEQMARADELGFDWVSFSEHHYMPELLQPNPLVMAAAASQVVKRAKLALLGPIVGFNDPIRIAEEIAMVDGLSGGRTVVLFLRSGGVEYAAYTGNLDESRERTQEASLLIERALTEPRPFGWEGRQFSYRTVSIWPRLVQKDPQFYYSGNSVESAEFAARNKWGLACSFFPPAFLAQVVDRYRQEAAGAGWRPTSDQIIYRGLCMVADTDEEAQAAASTSPYVSPGFGSLQFVGSPQTVIEQIREIHEIGFGLVDIAFDAGRNDHEAVMRCIELFATEVLPAVHAFDGGVNNDQEVSHVER